MKRSQTEEHRLTLLKSEIDDRLKEQYPNHRFKTRLSLTSPHIVDIEWTGGPSQMEVRSALRFPAYKQEYWDLDIKYFRKDD
jgi:hypothetical protein